MTDRHATVVVLPVRYGRGSYVAAVVASSVSVILTWALSPYIYLMFVVAWPFVLVTDTIALMIARLSTGTAARLARGVMIGSLAAPLSVVVVGGGFVLGECVG